MAQRYFEDSEHAKLYAKYRGTPPTELISRVIGYLEEKVDNGGLQLAVDVGCGSGQNTNLLAPYFRRVVGLDISEAQIAEAKKKTFRDNTEFMVSPAETLPFKEFSVQLLTSCVACHWFDLPNFYKEVDRLLVPDGVAAFYCYGFPSFVSDKDQDKLNQTVDDLVHGKLGKYWGHGIRHIESGYTEIDVPFAESVLRESFTQTFKRSLAELMAMVTTFSAFQTLRRVEGTEASEKIMSEFEERIKEILGTEGMSSEQINLTIMERWMLVMGRKCSNGKKA